MKVHKRAAALLVPAALLFQTALSVLAAEAGGFVGKAAPETIAAANQARDAVLLSPARSRSINQAGTGSLFFRDGEYEFWESIKKAIREAKPGGTVEVEAKWFDRMPIGVLDMIKGKDVILSIRWNGGADFQIHGQEALPSPEGHIQCPLATLYSYRMGGRAIANPSMGRTGSVSSPEVPPDLSSFLPGDITPLRATEEEALAGGWVPQSAGTVRNEASAGERTAARSNGGAPGTGPSNIFAAPSSANALPAAVSDLSGEQGNPFRTAATEKKPKDGIWRFFSTQRAGSDIPADEGEPEE